MNYKKQQEWDELICEKLQYYIQIYDKKKNRFVKLSQSPEKKGQEDGKKTITLHWAKVNSKHYWHCNVEND